MIQSHSNCWGQIKTFVLVINHIEKPPPPIVEVTPIVENKTIDIEEKLVNTPQSEYDLILGQINVVDLGSYQGDNTDQIFPFYQVSSTSGPELKTSLSEEFQVDANYKNQKLSLEIDLSTTDPLFVESKVTGELMIMTMDNQMLTYPVSFKLSCDSGSYCAIEDK